MVVSDNSKILTNCLYVTVHITYMQIVGYTSLNHWIQYLVILNISRDTALLST